MPVRVALEPNLTPLREYLIGKGYQVENIKFGEQSAKTLQGFDAIVVTGMNSNFMGISDTSTKAVVINADGMTPEDVEKELQRQK